MDRATVKRKFMMVKQVDRVGRMADTLEFSNVMLPLARFNDEILDELERLAPSCYEIDGDQIIIKHVYIERRMVLMLSAHHDACGLDEASVIERLAAWVADGSIKRLGVIVRHRELGFEANAMLVHDIPDDQVDDIAQALAGESASFSVALMAGSYRIGVGEVFAALFGNAGAGGDIVLQLRLPRALAGFACGGLLALAGALMQVLLRNPLADPYVLGISGGDLELRKVGPVAAIGHGFTGLSPTASSLAVGTVMEKDPRRSRA